MRQYRWLKPRKKTDLEPEVQMPVRVGSHSNGEYFHVQTPREAELERRTLERMDANARRVGTDRRSFMASAMGMATSMWVANTMAGCSSSDSDEKGKGGGYCLPKEAMYDESLACDVLSGNEFIFDVQTHHFDPDGEWVDTNPAYRLILPNCGKPAKEDCVSREEYLRIMFCESQTTMAALSTWPAALCTETRTVACGLPLPNDSVAASRDWINELTHSQRLVSHCQVMPNDLAGLDRQLAIMEEIACAHGLAAWKCYPAWGPNPNTGFFLDDPAIGIPFIEKGLSLGVNLFCVHKGLPIPGFDVEHNYPTEMGRVAKMFPDAKFIVYHSAICAGQDGFCNAVEGPYDPTNASGTDTLLKALEDAGVGPNSNVYAELGSAFSQVENDPIAAAHFIGKLLKHVGEDNVVWGTDSIVTGAPQPHIELFRALTIPQNLQEQYGYPELTPAIKAKVFGLNAAKIYGVDVEARRCAVPSCPTTQIKKQFDDELGSRRWTAVQPRGPRTRREFIALARMNRALGRPG